MIGKLLNRMNRINPWRFVWISIVSSEIIAFGLSLLQGRFWWRGVSKEKLLNKKAADHSLPRLFHGRGFTYFS